MLVLIAALIQGLAATTVFDFEAVDIHGTNQKLSQYTGDVTVVVNVASYWGLTPTNYKQLQQLHEQYYDQGLRILGFPSNQFGNQEPKSEAEILEFVKKYNVTFPLFSKIKVNGEDAHPLYKWLKSQLGGWFTDAIKWNFTKFLSDRKGVPYERYGPSTNPLSMEDDIIKLLAEQTV